MFYLNINCNLKSNLQVQNCTGLENLQQSGSLTHATSVLDYAIEMTVYINKHPIMGSYEGYTSESIRSNEQLKDKALKC